MKKHLLKVLAPSLLVLFAATGTVVGTTFALFTSNAKSDIAVTAGKVDVSASLSNIKTYSGLNLVGDPTLDTTWTDDLHGDFIDGGKAYLTDGNLLNIERIAPGDKVVFDLTTQNNSNISIK